MNKNVFFVLMFTIVVAFGLSVIACDTGTGGSGGTGGLGSTGIVNNTPSEPTIINGYYGVTSNGKLIELIIGSTSNSSNNIRSVDWSTSNSYTIKVGGVVVSQGTVTNTNGTITFTPSDGSTVTPSSNNGIIASLTVTDSKGTSYSGNMTEARNYYYCIGAATNYTFNQIKNIIAGKTPEDVYTYCLQHTDKFFDPHNYAGTFAEVAAWGKAPGNDCPDSEVQRITNDLNTGSISGVGYYSHKVQGTTYNVMFYISRMPLQ